MQNIPSNSLNISSHKLVHNNQQGNSESAKDDNNPRLFGGHEEKISDEQKINNDHVTLFDKVGNDVSNKVISEYLLPNEIHNMCITSKDMLTIGNKAMLSIISRMLYYKLAHIHIGMPDTDKNALAKVEKEVTEELHIVGELKKDGFSLPLMYFLIKYGAKPSIIKKIYELNDDKGKRNFYNKIIDFVKNDILEDVENRYPVIANRYYLFGSNTQEYLEICSSKSFYDICMTIDSLYGRLQKDLQRINNPKQSSYDDKFKKGFLGVNYVKDTYDMLGEKIDEYIEGIRYTDAVSVSNQFGATPAISSFAISMMMIHFKFDIKSIMKLLVSFKPSDEQYKSMFELAYNSFDMENKKIIAGDSDYNIEKFKQVINPRIITDLSEVDKKVYKSFGELGGHNLVSYMILSGLTPKMNKEGELDFGFSLKELHLYQILMLCHLGQSGIDIDSLTSLIASDSFKKIYNIEMFYNMLVQFGGDNIKKILDQKADLKTMFEQATKLPINKSPEFILYGNCVGMTIFKAKTGR